MILTEKLPKCVSALVGHKRKYLYSAGVCMLQILSCMALGGCVGKWAKDFSHELPSLGHRNWVLVVDEAYPSQVSPGIETIVTNEDHVKVLEYALKSISKASHVRPTIFLDKEFKSVSEKDAPAVGEYRQRLLKLLAPYNIQYVKHEDLIRDVDAAARNFKIIVLKSNMKIPYTSVFLRLECGYWSDAQEQKRIATERAMKE